MQTQRLPDDARRILGAYNRAVLEASQRTVLRTAMATENPAPAVTRHKQTPGGDPRELRGIPAIGRNVAGAIPGSSPHAVR